MESMTIEKLTIPYRKEQLSQWKQRDPDLVPNCNLDKKGPGVINGYGYGEWVAERYFRGLGYYVFTNSFDIISQKTKYKRFNQMIQAFTGSDKLHVFRESVRELKLKGYKIENPDLFVFNLDHCFFAEVKKGKDQLRQPQTIFFYLAKKRLGIDSKLIYLDDKALIVEVEQAVCYFDFPK